MEQQLDLDTLLPSTRVHTVDTDPCSVAYPLFEVAQAAGAPLGFETLPDCRSVGWGQSAEQDGDVLTGMTVRQVIDRVLSSAPDYAWREMDGVVVVRPKAAWADLESPLCVRTDAIEVNASVNEVLDALTCAAKPSLYHQHDDVQRFSVLMTRAIRYSFKGGTFLDGLNALVRAHGRLEWVLVRQPLTVWVHELRFPGDSTATPLAFPPRTRVSAPVTTPTTPRP